ncbi:phytoene synthase/lycopene cyclase [Spinellus fusiger]|nr:phytoene synthase/lycopene cyclase [Spinellus fusiger]
MLNYMEVHLYFTLPVLGLILFILKPFYTSNDGFKYAFMSLVAFTTASLWDNYIVYHRAWFYCPTCVVAVIGYVPLEEYMFFIIMTLITLSFSTLVMRWHLPSFYIKPETPLLQSLCIRCIPIIGFIVVAIKAWSKAIPDTAAFYGGCILWYTFPVLALLCEYILRRWKSVLISIALPTLFLCMVDQYAISQNTWSISRRTSTGKMVVPHLPLEEFIFFLLINVVLVFASCAIDRSQAILDIYFKPTSDRKPMPLLTHLRYLCWAFFQMDQSLDLEVLSDLNSTWNILREASASFYTASCVFSCDVRQDLGALYAFCRATDDIADDNTVPLEERKAQLKLVRGFVHDLFKELLDGYTWDLEGRQVETEADLVYYSACVASSVGEIFNTIQWVIERARDMGLALQFTNIARDIVTDSESLGRCYLPTSWLTSQELASIQAGKARSLGDKRLCELSQKLILTADTLNQKSLRAIDHLPYSTRCGVRAACAIYNAIGGRIVIALRSIYNFPTHSKGIQRKNPQQEGFVVI